MLGRRTECERSPRCAQEQREGAELARFAESSRYVAKSQLLSPKAKPDQARHRRGSLLCRRLSVFVLECGNARPHELGAPHTPCVARRKSLSNTPSRSHGHLVLVSTGRSAANHATPPSASTLPDSLARSGHSIRRSPSPALVPRLSMLHNATPDAFASALLY